VGRRSRRGGGCRRAHRGGAHGLGYIVVAHVLAAAAPPLPTPPRHRYRYRCRPTDVTERHNTLLSAAADGGVFAARRYTRAHGHQTAAPPGF